MISTVVTIVASFTAAMAWSRASELGEDEASHADHRINVKSPDYCRGSGFIGGLLLLRHAGVGCRITRRQPYRSRPLSWPWLRPSKS